MATLLCSLLIANRYGALVVSGYASREVTNNDKQRVVYPEIPERSSEQQSKVQTRFMRNFYFENQKFAH